MTVYCDEQKITSVVLKNRSVVKKTSKNASN